MKEWHQKYAKDGLVVIGVHVPRIDYEKELPRIREAVVKKGIEYPVVVDNNYAIWSDYLCNVWPSHFVVDQNGVSVTGLRARCRKGHPDALELRV